MAERVILPYYGRHFVKVYYQEDPVYVDLHSVIDNLIQSFFQETVINSASVPVIITDSTRQTVIAAGNLDTNLLKNPLGLKQELKRMNDENNPIELDLIDIGKCFVYYENSPVLRKLRIFPYIELGFLLVFIIIAYLLFSTQRRSEQNRVWVGMSKETAHQLGTPISSLMAWTELLREMPIDQSIPTEIGKEIIMQSDLEKNYLDYTSQFKTVEDPFETKCFILETLMFNKLLVNQAELDSIEITDEEVDYRINARMSYFLQQVGGNEKYIEEYFHKGYIPWSSAWRWRESS